MRFVTVRELKARSASVWKELGESREIVVTSNGRPVAVLSAVDDETLEETLGAIRRARAVAAVDEMQRRSVKAGLDRLTDEEIEAEIAAVRAARRNAQVGGG